MRAMTFFAALLALLPGHAPAADPPPTTAGPFTIESGSKRISSGTFPNIGSNPFARTTVSDYRVLFRGKPVVVGEANARLDRFWDARVLAGAPEPAVLVATTGAWLLTEKNGALDVQTLVPPSTDIVRWQWLDSNNGQPGPEQAVTIRDSSAEPRTLAEGKVMLIGRRGVLAVESLRFTPVPVTAWETLQKLDGFHAGNVEVKALSPGRTQIVFVGDRRKSDLFEYALVVFDFAAGGTYAVPFDSNALRFESVWDATPAWLAQYFEWSREAGGAERIRLRQPVRSQPWQGRLVRSYDDIEYRLHPVGAGLADPLRKTIEAEFAATRVAPTYGDPNDPNSTSYDAGGKRFRLWYDPERRNLSVFAEKIKGFTTTGTPTLIEAIGTRFNAILATGAHQREFTSYLDHR